MRGTRQLDGLRIDDGFTIQCDDYTWILAERYSLEKLSLSQFSKDDFFQDLLQSSEYIEVAYDSVNSREEFRGPYVLSSINATDFKLILWDDVKSKINQFWHKLDSSKDIELKTLFLEVETSTSLCFALDEKGTYEERLWNYLKLFYEFIILNFEQRRVWILTIGKD